MKQARTTSQLIQRTLCTNGYAVALLKIAIEYSRSFALRSRENGAESASGLQYGLLKNTVQVLQELVSCQGNSAYPDPLLHQIKRELKDTQTQVYGFEIQHSKAVKKTAKDLRAARESANQAQRTFTLLANQWLSRARDKSRQRPLSHLMPLELVGQSPYSSDSSSTDDEDRTRTCWPQPRHPQLNSSASSASRSSAGNNARNRRISTSTSAASSMSSWALVDVPRDGRGIPVPPPSTRFSDDAEASTAQNGEDEGRDARDSTSSTNSTRSSYSSAHQRLFGLADSAGSQYLGCTTEDPRKLQL